MAHSLVAKSPTPEADTQSLCRTTPMKTMRSDGSKPTVILFASSCALVFLPLGVGIVISNNVQKKPAPL